MTPFDGAIAAARTCYSPRVISAAEVTDSQRDVIGALTFDAGHHTVYQHANFEFGLENVSGSLSGVSHSYPLHSEQSSQRYVKLASACLRCAAERRSAECVRVRGRRAPGIRYAELSALLKGRCTRDPQGAALRSATTNPNA